MEIEILYAIDHDNYNEKVNLLAVPYGETAGEDFIKQTLEDRLGIFGDDEETNKGIDELVKTIDTGEETEYHEYEFGWDVVEYRN